MIAAGLLFFGIDEFLLARKVQAGDTKLTVFGSDPRCFGRDPAAIEVACRNPIPLFFQFPSLFFRSG